MTPEPAPIRIGPSGWNYEDWHGIVYPAPAPRRFDALAYLGRFFNAIEVNSTFYHPPAARTVASWVRRVPPPADFKFTVKLWQGLTHRRDEPYDKGAARDFLAALQPMFESGHFGCLLIQFPWSFRCSDDAFDWLAPLADDVRDARPVIEVRHASWDNEAARDRLAALGLSYCNVDQPALRDCIGANAHVTGPIGYFRFHGRRRDTWFAANISPHERYNYLYSPAELEEWTPRIREVAVEAAETFVFTNNHYRGQAPANALQLRAMLGEHRVMVPPPMIDHFPALAGISAPSAREASDRTLFD
jgi:uncharacterized protein YecE (DUF72 family)